MKRLILVFTLALLSVSSAFAQMGRGYSGYTNFGMDANNNLFVTAVLDGSTSCNYIPPGYNCASIRHTGEVFVSIAGVMTENQGVPVPPDSYISVSDTGTKTNAQPGVEYKITTVEKIICTIAGSFAILTVSFNGGISLSNLQWDGQPPSGNTCHFDLSCPGTSKATCPILTLAEISVTKINSCPADGLPFRWLTQAWSSAYGNVTCYPVAFRGHSATALPCQ